MRLKIFLAVAIITGCSLSPLFAFTLDDGPGSFFGKGVHAFFAGDYQKSYTELNEAVKAKTIDPRVYLFRGLALYRMDRADAAKKDFQQGARLEVSKSNYFFDVNKSLRRIQGEERLLIENARAAARVEAKQAAQKLASLRYEATRSQEDRVLRKSVPQKIATVFQDSEAKSEPPKAEPAKVEPAEAAAPAPQAKAPAAVSKNVRANRLFQALRGSVGAAVQGSLPKGVTPPGLPMGDPAKVKTVDPASSTPFGDDPFAEPDDSKSSEDDDPFGATSPKPDPAVEFSKIEDLPLDGSNSPELLVVTFPKQQEPESKIPEPAPSFEKVEPTAEEPAAEAVVAEETPLDVPAAEKLAAEEPMPASVAEAAEPEVTITEELSLQVSAAPKLEEMVEPVVELPAAEEASQPEPETVASEPAPAVEPEEPVAEVVPPVVPEAVNEDPNKTLIAEKESEPSMPVVVMAEPEEPEPLLNKPIEIDPASSSESSLAKADSNAVPRDLNEKPTTEVPAAEEPVFAEAPAPAVEEAPVVEPVAEEPAAEELATTVKSDKIDEPAKEEPAVQEPVAEEPALAANEPVVEESAEDPFGNVKLAKEEPKQEVAVSVVTDDPFASSPNPAEKKLTTELPSAKETIATNVPVQKQAEPEASVVSKTPVAENPVVKEPVAAPNPEKPKKSSSGASAIPSLDLKNLPPEDDPFA